MTKWDCLSAMKPVQDKPICLLTVRRRSNLKWAHPRRARSVWIVPIGVVEEEREMFIGSALAQVSSWALVRPCRLVSFRLISFRFVSIHLISVLVSSHLILTQLISTQLISSRAVAANSTGFELSLLASMSKHCRRTRVSLMEKAAWDEWLAQARISGNRTTTQRGASMRDFALLSQSCY